MYIYDVLSSNKNYNCIKKIKNDLKHWLLFDEIKLPKSYLQSEVYRIEVCLGVFEPHDKIKVGVFILPTFTPFTHLDRYLNPLGSNVGVK